MEATVNRSLALLGSRNPGSSPTEKRLIETSDTGKDMYFDSLLFDVQTDLPRDITVNGVPVHKFILCAKSEYFKSMLSGSFAENNEKEITIDWIPKELIEHVVEYLYFQEFRIPTTAIAALYKVADYFMMPTLRSDCIKVLEESVTPKSYFHILATFHVVGDDVSKLCTKKLTSLYASAIRSPGGMEAFQKLPYVIVHTLLSSRFLGTSEERIVVDPVIKWLEKGSNSSKAEQLLKLIRWNQLTDLYLCFLATQQAAKGKKGATLLRFVHEGMRYKLKRNSATPDIRVEWPTDPRLPTVSTHTYMFDAMGDSMSDHDGY